MKKKNMLILILLLFLMGLYIFYAQNVFSQNEGAENAGIDVSITVDCEEADVMPNKNVKYEPIIHYKGVSGYIRIGVDTNNEFINASHFNGLNGDWVKRGDYFYYTKPVYNNENIKTFESFKVPRYFEADEIMDLQGSKFNITCRCDAIQAEGLTPDFNKREPWGEGFVVNGSDVNSNSYDNEDSKWPTTGDSNTFGSLILLIAALVAVYLLSKKKRGDKL